MDRGEHALLDGDGLRELGEPDVARRNGLAGLLQDLRGLPVGRRERSVGGVPRGAHRLDLAARDAGGTGALALHFDALGEWDVVLDLTGRFEGSIAHRPSAPMPLTVFFPGSLSAFPYPLSKRGRVGEQQANGWSTPGTQWHLQVQPS